MLSMLHRQAAEKDERAKMVAVEARRHRGASLCTVLVEASRMTSSVDLMPAVHQLSYLFGGE
jgi:hypothetical protein